MPGDLIRGARAAQQHQLGRELPDARQLPELREGLRRGQRPEAGGVEAAVQGGDGEGAEPFGLATGQPGNPSREASRCGAGNADSARPPKETAWPSSLAIRALIAAACRILIRAPMIAQAAAS